MPREAAVAPSRAMIHSNAPIETLRALAADAVIVGAGPLGIVTALRLAGQGRRVLVLESGGRRHSAAAQAFARAELVTPQSHHEPAITTARRLGGTANLWGGRCVPFDAIDFEPRPWLDMPGWPIRRADLDGYLAEACAGLGAGAGPFVQAADGVAPQSPDFTLDTLERWSNTPRTHRLHAKTLQRHPDLHVALNVTVTGFEYDAEGRIAALGLWRDGHRATLPVGTVILSGGGNAVVQLLLNERHAHPALFGGPEGPLGRYYMGHVNGQIADIAIADARLDTALAFFRTGGAYARRRLAPSAATQRAQALANVAFWPVVPPIAVPDHRSGPLSAAFLALSMPSLGGRLIAEPIRRKHVGAAPYRRLAHLRNVLSDPVATTTVVPHFLWQRFGARHRMPGFFLHNRQHRYGLEFHSEHLPDSESRITLAGDWNAAGQYRLRIDLRFGAGDADSVVRAHEALDAWLAAERLGHLVYRVPGAARRAAVIDTARHGNHQIGTARMARSPADGVVDGWGTSFCIPNLHIVSTAVLPTSSQAPPTLTAAQLGLRLADHLVATNHL